MKVPVHLFPHLRIDNLSSTRRDTDGCQYIGVKVSLYALRNNWVVIFRDRPSTIKIEFDIGEEYIKQVLDPSILAPSLD